MQFRLIFWIFAKAVTNPLILKLSWRVQGWQQNRKKWFSYYSALKDAQLREVGDWTDCGLAGDIDNYQIEMTFTTMKKKQTDNRKAGEEKNRRQQIDNKSEIRHSNISNMTD